MSPAQAKAHFVIEITKHIEWPDDDGLARFRIAVLSQDAELKEAFLARARERVRGKPFVFEFLESTDFPIDEYTHVYLGSRHRGLNDTLFERARKTLIIVDGPVDREQQMLSLITSARELSLRLNRANLAQRGFEASISLLEFAGTRQDLSDQLRDSQARLEQLLAEVTAKEQRVEDLNRILTENSATLEAARAALESSQQELESTRGQLRALSAQVDNAQAEVERYQAEIAAQQKRFAQTQAEIEDRERAIAELETQIARNQRLLDRQLEELARQRQMLTAKSEQILVQRELLIIALAGLLVFLVLAYFLQRANRLRKRANEALAELNEQLYEQATIDGITGLFNRRHFLASAQQAFARQRRARNGLAMLMMDIDRFKRINDSHGHPAGDEVIRAVGGVLQRNLREYDLVGRVGGEEYAMLLVDCDLEQGLAIAQRVCDDVAAEEIAFGEVNLRVTISIGVSRVEPDDDDIDQVLVRADKALYAAKEQGRNRVVAYRPGPGMLGTRGEAR